MELILSSMSAGGLVGVSNQYLFVLILCLAGRFKLIELAPQMQFMESWVFIGVVAVLWLLTIAPAYSSLLSPGVMNAINTVTNFLSGFLVPASSALIALASAGAIANLSPQMRESLEAIQLFTPQGGIGRAGVAVAGGSALIATALTGTKAAAKPALSASSGTTGHISAPIFATAENVASVVVAVLLYLLANISPWLLVALLGVAVVIVVGMLVYAIVQLRRLGRGVGRVMRLVEEQPKAGLAIVFEAVVWGAGSLVWEYWARGLLRVALWAIWLLILIVVIPAATTALTGLLAAAPPLLALPPLLGTVGFVMTLMIGLALGLRSARSLIRLLEKDGRLAATAGQGAKGTVGETAAAP